MERVAGPGATPGGLFTEGDPQTGDVATTVTADVMNAIQEELAQFVESAGITLQSGVYTQLQAAMGVLAGAARQRVNLLRNPAFRLRYREAFTASPLSSTALFCDGWYGTPGDGTSLSYSISYRTGANVWDHPFGSQVNLTPAGTTSSAAAGIFQRVANVLQLSRPSLGQPVKATLSFWARAIGGTQDVVPKIVQDWGSSGGSADDVTTLSTVTVAQSTGTYTGFQRYYVTGTLVAPETRTLGAEHTFGVALQYPIGAAGNQLQVTGVKLELGDRVSPTIPLCETEELHQVLEYIEQSWGYGAHPGSVLSGGSGACYHPDTSTTIKGMAACRYIVPKLLAWSPTVTWWNPTNGNQDAVDVAGTSRAVSSNNNATEHGPGYPTVANATAGLVLGDWQADFEPAFLAI